MTTKHTCGGCTFGRKTPGCPRCDELLAGAAPITQAWRKRETDDQRLCREIRAHVCGASCGSVCTFGEW